MAIEQTSAISALTKVTNRDPKELTAPVRDKKVQAEETVRESAFSPSELQKQLLAPGKNDINTARVAEIKQALKDGTLRMDSRPIPASFVALPPIPIMNSRHPRFNASATISPTP